MPLDSQPPITDTFNTAALSDRKPVDRNQRKGGRGSEMVKASQSGLHEGPIPPGWVRAPVKHLDFQKKVDRENRLSHQQTAGTGNGNRVQSKVEKSLTREFNLRSGLRR